MVKVLIEDNWAGKDFSEEAACVSFPAAHKKVEGDDFYRVEMTDQSGEKSIYWYNSK